jgi:hypothetical protein
MFFDWNITRSGIVVAITLDRVLRDGGDKRVGPISTSESGAKNFRDSGRGGLNVPVLVHILKYTRGEAAREANLISDFEFEI